MGPISLSFEYGFALPRNKFWQVCFRLIYLLGVESWLSLGYTISKLAISNQFGYLSVFIQWNKGIWLGTVTFWFPVRGSLFFKATYNNHICFSNIEYLCSEYGNFVVQNPAGRKLGLCSFFVHRDHAPYSPLINISVLNGSPAAG